MVTTKNQIVERLAPLDELIAEFDGAIKYTPMLLDHGPGSRDPWTREECVRFARHWHAVAVERIREAMRREAAGYRRWDRQVPRWNDRIPYCRNVATPAMIAEARR